LYVDHGPSVKSVSRWAGARDSATTRPSFRIAVRVLPHPPTMKE